MGKAHSNSNKLVKSEASSDFASALYLCQHEATYKAGKSLATHVPQNILNHISYTG
jgi:hypothetical protein